MNNTKWLKVALLSAAASLIFPLSGCTPKSEAASATGDEVVAVAPGDISINITAAGNLSYSQQEDLAFEMAGYVEEVSVEVGDSVAQGQVLATLDASDWEDSLAALQDKVTAAQRSLLQAQISLKNAQVALDNAENPYTDDDIKQAKQDLALAEEQLRYDSLHGSSSVLQDQQDVYTKQQTYDDMKAGGDEDDIAVKQMQYDLAEGQMEDAQTTLTKTQKDLADAQSESPEITAPFDGFITQVNVSGGDEVYKGTVAMQIADPTKFKAGLLVSEMDIYDVKLGSEAQVTVSAVEGVSLPAEVTYISPTATVSSGVVNYDVTVEVEPLDTIREQESVENTPSPTATLLPQDFELKEGLSVVVSIVIQQASDVLLVPNRAITYQAGEAHVQVVAADSTTEDRTIQTGISDYQNTEVTSGLTEGEKVIVPQSTTTITSTTQQDQGAAGGMMIPGIGGGGGPPSGGGGAPPG
jgi:multidrug efflux pump subunit AcrA (membrane-fusion protein)